MAIVSFLFSIGLLLASATAVVAQPVATRACPATDFTASLRTAPAAEAATVAAIRPNSLTDPDVEITHMEEGRSLPTSG